MAHSETARPRIRFAIARSGRLAFLRGCSGTPKAIERLAALPLHSDRPNRLSCRFMFAASSRGLCAPLTLVPRSVGLDADGRGFVKGIQRYPKIVLMARLRSVHCGTFGSPPSEPPCDAPPYSRRRLVTMFFKSPELFANTKLGDTYELRHLHRSNPSHHCATRCWASSLVSPLKKTPAETVTPVVAHRPRRLKPAHPRHQIRLRSFDHEMVMVAHPIRQAQGAGSTKAWTRQPVRAGASPSV